MLNEDRRSYIVTDELLLNGEPIIRGTKTPVRAIVELWRLGIQPEEIPTHLPHIGLAQVFDALRYYAENQLQINHYIEINRVPEELIHPVTEPSSTQGTLTSALLWRPDEVPRKLRDESRCS